MSDKKLQIVKIHAVENSKLAFIECIARGSYTLCLETGCIYEGLVYNKEQRVTDPRLLNKITKALVEYNSKLVRHSNLISKILDMGL